MADRETTIPVSLVAKTHALLEQENRRLREALDGLVILTAGLARNADLVDRALALSAIAFAREVLGTENKQETEEM